MWKIPLFDLNYTHEETDATVEVLNSRWLVSGPKVKEFEDNFASYLGHGVKACAVTNCTAALHMSLLVAGIKEGDEVIVSSLSFVAALNVISVVGATPVLADSKSFSDWNISVEDVSRKISSKTKAVIVVHYAGYPSDLDELQKLCQEKNIILIEDVAHAIGAEYKGQQCGTFGDISCFSFFGNKNLSTGEGGMIVTKKEELDKKVRLWRSHGMTSMTVDRHEGKIISYDVLQPGLNYRMTEITAAIGLVQLRKLDKSNKVRKDLTAAYHKSLSEIKNLIIPWANLESYKTSSYHIMPVLLPEGTERLKVINDLKSEGIQTSIHYPSYKNFSYYKELLKDKIEVIEQVCQRELTLPLYPDMKIESVYQVCEAMKKSLK